MFARSAVIAVALLAAVALAVPVARAEVVQNHDFSGGSIVSITLHRTEGTTVVTPNELVLGTLTAVDFPAQARVLVPDGGSAPTPRADVLQDHRVDTGLVNVESISVYFDTIVDRAGFDLLFADWGGNDTFDVTISGLLDGQLFQETVQYDPADFYDSDNFSLDIVDSDDPSVNTLAEFEAAGYSYAADTSADVGLYGFTLGDFGLPLGSDLTDVTVTISDPDTPSIDPLFLSAIIIPEPATLTLLAAGALALDRRRRNR